MVQLADFRQFGGEFQCFKCSALIPLKDIAFRILDTEEMEKIRKRSETEETNEQDPAEYFKKAATNPSAPKLNILITSIVIVFIVFIILFFTILFFHNKMLDK